jgi:hypothetical protein
MKPIFRFVRAFLIAALIGVAAGATDATSAAEPLGLSPVHHQPFQVSSCEILGKSFGTLLAGGNIRYQGENYPVDASHVSGALILFTGPNVKATFRASHGRPVDEGDNGEPLRIGVDVAGTLRIEVAGRVLTVPAREHCTIFE